MLLIRSGKRLVEDVGMQKDVLQQFQSSGEIEAVTDPLINGKAHGNGITHFIGTVIIEERDFLSLIDQSENGIGAPVDQVMIDGRHPDGAQIGHKAGRTVGIDGGQGLGQFVVGVEPEQQSDEGLEYGAGDLGDPLKLL